MMQAMPRANLRGTRHTTGSNVWGPGRVIPRYDQTLRMDNLAARMKNAVVVLPDPFSAFQPKTLDREPPALPTDAPVIRPFRNPRRALKTPAVDLRR